MSEDEERTLRGDVTLRWFLRFAALGLACVMPQENEASSSCGWAASSDLKETRRWTVVF